MPAEFAPVTEVVVIKELEGEKRHAKAKGWAKEMMIIVEASPPMSMPAPPHAPPFSRNG
jgi:hypothetical protein